MLPIIILTIVVIVLGVGLAYSVFRKFPDLKNLDISSIASAKTKATRSKILEAKFQRGSEEFKKKFNASITPKIKSVSDAFAKMKERVIALETHYKMKDQVHQSNAKPQETKSVEEIIEEGRELMDKDEFAAAEKKLIEAVAKDKKNFKAYESLGELYYDNRCFDQAAEIYQHLIRLYAVAAVGKKDPHLKNGKFQELETELLNSIDIDVKVAVYYAALAKAEEAMDRSQKALDCYLKASAVEPKNPRYINKIIELAIEAKDKDLARTYWVSLKKINPENAKLVQLQAAIENI